MFIKAALFSLAVLALCVSCSRQSTTTTDSPSITTTSGLVEMSPQQARPGIEAAYSQFIDVRTPEEYAAGHANRTRNIPLDQLPEKLSDLEKAEPVYLICKSGVRSKKAAQILVDNGFKQAISINGGTDAWEAAGLPMAP